MTRADAAAPASRSGRPYPAMLDLRGRPVVVVGAGSVATRKIADLLAAGARLTVISPVVSSRVARWADDGRLRLVRRRYRAGDLRDACLVIAATSSPTEHRAIANEARRISAWVNVVDQPVLCSFIAPAVVTRGDLIIAISTSGRNPALARWIKQVVATVIGPEYSHATRLLGAVRAALRDAGHPPAERARMVRRLMASPLLAQLRRGDHAAAARTIRRIATLEACEPRVPHREGKK